MQSAPRTLLLDVLGTLVRDPFPGVVCAFLGVGERELLAAKDPHAWIEFEHGRIGEDELFERFFSDRRPIDGPGLRAATFAGYALLPGIEPLLAELRRTGVALHALSNYPLWYHAIEERTRLSRFLSWSFVSCDTGLRKPDPRAWEHALAALGIAPGAAVFVDDKEGNVAAARALGIDSVRFAGADALRAELTRRGLLAAAP